MSFDFTGRRIVVTGASRGIGRAIALHFAAAGAHVSICARGADALERTRIDIAKLGRRTHSATCDMADAAAVAGYIASAGAALGGIDVLVNNASGFGMGDDEAAWAAELAVDVMGMVRTSHAAVPMLETSPGSSIVHIASIAGLRASARTPAYGAAKAAMISYTASQAAMLARKGVRANCIAPGSIEFPGGIWERRRLDGDPLYQRVVASIPFGRLGMPDEIAEVAMFLASPSARWITGQTIVVDGGQLLGG
ncbi:putative oxidoreductase [Burkholderiales bacterium]|nr:putative oxidoreductase [Burkholderiales bacterium]